MEGYEDERRETLLRDKYGDYKEWAKVAGIFLVVLGIFLFVVGIAIGVQVVSDKHEVRAFNRIHGTDYAFGEWFWAQSTIKNYHLGTVENKNYQVDLNIKEDRIEGGG